MTEFPAYCYIVESDDYQTPAIYGERVSDATDVARMVLTDEDIEAIHYDSDKFGWVCKGQIFTHTIDGHKLSDVYEVVERYGWFLIKIGAAHLDGIEDIASGLKQIVGDSQLDYEDKIERCKPYFPAFFDLLGFSYITGAEDWIVAMLSEVVNAHDPLK